MDLPTLSLIIALATLDVAAAGSKRQQASLDPEQIVCKRELETGSLVKTRKICMARREWQAWRADAQRTQEQWTRQISGERGN